jgi:hypothetical protein
VTVWADAPLLEQPDRNAKATADSRYFLMIREPQKLG